MTLDEVRAEIRAAVEHYAGTRRGVTLPQGLAVALLVGGIGWATSTFFGMYRDSAVSAKQTECTRELNDMRDREVDEIHRRLTARETQPLCCACSTDKGR